MSDEINIDNLLEELVKNVSAKLDKQQKEIDQLKYELIEVRVHLSESSDKYQNDLLNQFNKIKSELILTNSELKLPDHANDQSIYLEFNKLQNQINELSKKIDSFPQKTIHNDNYTNELTQLPAYNKTELFKEIRRPVNLNELYMMVLQSQRTINELQMNMDNIRRRN